MISANEKAPLIVVWLMKSIASALTRRVFHFSSSSEYDDNYEEMKHEISGDCLPNKNSNFKVIQIPFV